jgi:hypothetical protein
MIRLLVTAATLSGLLRHVFGRERVARGGARRKASAKQARRRKTVRRAR